MKNLVEFAALMLASVLVVAPITVLTCSAGLPTAVNNVAAGIVSAAIAIAYLAVKHRKRGAAGGWPRWMAVTH